HAALVAAGVAEDTPWQGFALWAPQRQRVALMKGETAVAVDLMARPGGWDVAVGDVTVALRRDAGGWRAEGARMPQVLRHGAAVTVFGPDPLRFAIPDALARGGAEGGGDAVLAPMPGLVAQVAVAVGQTVTAGDRMVVLEAMKMEHVLRAPRDGVVAEVAVAQGDQVKAGVALVTLAVVD
ncbi:MAG: 3-methylcrotonyl-CoA carboxylase, partial [Alphaproteobacteria bacterium]|nr:3-methylcrotonyl-CoA carboxylase [Alphaproteobacteria bacterium]